MKSRAYRDGYKDGLAWDLTGFEGRADVARHCEGWDDATLSAVGCEACCRAWGLKSTSGRAWDRARKEYNAGAYRGALEQRWPQYREEEG